MKYEKLKEKCQTLGGKIEEKLGFEMFAKCGWSSLNKLLVKKGIITEEDLLKSFYDEAKIFLKEVEDE